MGIIQSIHMGCFKRQNEFNFFWCDLSFKVGRDFILV